MSVDLSIRPMGAVAAAPVPTPVPAAAKTAVETQLPPGDAVIQPDAAALAQNQVDTGRNSNQVIIDRAAAEVVYRTVDTLTNFVVKQFPDEAILRARAYGRALDIARQEQAQKSGSSNLNLVA